MALVAVFLLDLLQFRLDDRKDIPITRQDFLKLCNPAFQFLIFVVDLFLLKTGQATQTHIDDSLRLRLVKVELKVFRTVDDAEQRDLVNPERLGHQVFLGLRLVFGRADDGDDTVDVVGRNLETLKDMRAVARLLQIKACSALDNVLLEHNILVDDLAQRQNTRLQFAICARYERNVNHRNCVLQLGVGEQLVQNHLRVCVAANIDHDLHAFARGMVLNIGNAVDALVLDEVCHRLHETRLIDHVGNLGDLDLAPAVWQVNDLRLGAHLDLAAAGGIGRADAAAPHDNAAGREVRPLDELTDLVHLGFRVVDDIADAVDDLGQVMRRDVGRHTDCNTRRTVDQQIREAGREHDRLLPLFIEVRLKIDRILFDIGQHVVGELCHTGFGITVSCRGVAVDRTEVAMAVDQRVVQRKRLRQTHEGIVYRCVAVRMVTAEHITDGRCRLAVGLIRGQAVLVHRIQDAPVYRLEAVAHIGQRAAYNDAHRIVDVALFHLFFEVDLFDILVFVFLTHSVPPKLLALCGLDIEVHYILGVFLDKLTPRFDLFAHQQRKGRIGRRRVLHCHLQQRAVCRVHRGLP